MQMTACVPAMTAVTAMMLDPLSGGRFLLGLGVSVEAKKNQRPLPSREERESDGAGSGRAGGRGRVVRTARGWSNGCERGANRA